MRNSMLPRYNNGYGNYNNYNDYSNPNNRRYYPQYSNQNYNNDYNNDYDYDSYNNNSPNSDIAYLLSSEWKKKFNNNYDSLSIDERLAKLENNVFGAAQGGDYVNRVNRLKQAFAAEANPDMSSQWQRQIIEEVTRLSPSSLKEPQPAFLLIQTIIRH